MNATGEADLANFYDHVGSKQGKIFRHPLNRAVDVVQMHLYGEIDPGIKAGFAPLTDEDDAARASTQKTEADRDASYLNTGVLDQAEVRKRLHDDPGSGYSFIDPEQVPESQETGGEEAASPQDGAGGLEDDAFLQNLKKLLGLGEALHG